MFASELERKQKMTVRKLAVRALQKKTNELRRKLIVSMKGTKKKKRLPKLVSFFFW